MNKTERVILEEALDNILSIENYILEPFELRALRDVDETLFN